jgi:ppGpp synthetase/RelA/SpoT-type nucleotidyltranferase
MAKKLVKVEVKENKLQPNAVLLEEGEILSATCDIYKFNLSKKNKLGQLAARDLGEGYDEDDFDFCLLRVKDSLLEKLEKKEITLLYKSDRYDETNDDIVEITSLDSLLEYIDDYITNNEGEFLFERFNKKDQVYFIPYLDNLI